MDVGEDMSQPIIKRMEDIERQYNSLFDIVTKALDELQEHDKRITHLHYIVTNLNRNFLQHKDEQDANKI